MRIRGPRLVIFLIFIFVLLLVFAWASRPGRGPVANAVSDAGTPTLVATAPLPTETPLPTVTPPPTATPSPSATATERPTATPSPTPSHTPLPSATFTPSATPVDRVCPDPPPQKPPYAHHYLSGSAWPTPDPAGFEPHFLLSRPILPDSEWRVSEYYPYGYDGGNRYLLHNGLDVAEPLGNPVLAVADGTVVVAQDDFTERYGWRCDWYGHLVVIELDERWQGQPVYVLYGHVLNISVEAGQRVEAGDPVAEIGYGGVATAPHLHLEVRVGGNEFGMTQNPRLWLEPGEGFGVVAGRLLDPRGRPWQGVEVLAIGQSSGTNQRRTWTYLDDPQHLVNPDPALAENFVLADLRPGRYEIRARVQGEVYTATVGVPAGGVATVELVTQPFKAPTPTPPATAAPPTPTVTPTLTE